MAYKIKSILLVSIVGALLSACGGGGGASTASNSSSTSISGVAATGAALQDPTVTLFYSGGSKACAITNADTGAYSCDTTGLAAPFVVKVVGTANESVVLLSSATTSNTGTVNITPVTNAIVATTAGADPVSLDPNTLITTLKNNPALLNDAKTAYKTLFANVLAATGNTGLDLISGSLVVGNSNQDKFLDAINIEITPSGSIKLATVAGLSSDTPQTLTIPVVNTPAQVQSTSTTNLPTTATVNGVNVDLNANPFSAADLAFLQQQWTNCYASTATTRNNGSYSGCANLLVDNASPLLAGMPNSYLSNGQNALQVYASYLNDEGMNNARFGLPQIIRIQGKDASGKVNKAWVKFGFVRSDGLVDGFEEIIQIVKTPSANDSGWRLVGNQREVLSRVRPYAARRSWLNPANQATGVDAYLAELQVSVGTTDKNNTAVDFAIVTGPGLPTDGLLLRPSTGACTFLNITAQLVAGDLSGDDASVAAGKFAGNYAKRSNCSSRFRIGGIAVNASQQASFVWPNSRNWLTSPLNSSQINAIGPFSAYTFRIYQSNNSTSPAYKYTTLMRSGMISPTDMVSYTWHDISIATLNTLNPTHPSAFTGGARFPVVWVSKSGVQPVFNINVQVLPSGSSIVDGSIGQRPVAPGTTVTANVPGTIAYPAITNVSASGNFSFAQLQWQSANGLYFASAYEYDK